MDHKKIKELAKKCGCSKAMMYYIIAGTRAPSRKLATRFELVTGVKREAWIWPEHYKNFWIEEVKKNGKN